MILIGPVKLIIGPGGRHNVAQPSDAGLSSRFRAISRPHARASAGLKSEPPVGPACHSPDRSGLPSAVRGAGADRFGLPSAVLGIPTVGCVNHCAAPVDGRRTSAKKVTLISRARWTVIQASPSIF